jgi:Uma2 family endonuclease
MVAAKLVTVDEFTALPLEGIWELVDGEMIELSRNAGRSGWVGGQLVACLTEHVRPRRLGWVFPADTGFVLFDDRATVRSPDAAFVRLDRLPELPNTFVPVAPDLAAEVLSPSDRMADALAKVAMYLDVGVRLVLLIDPETQTITVFRPDGPLTKLSVGDTLDGGDVLPGFSIPVAEIFA